MPACATSHISSLPCKIRSAGTPLAGASSAAVRAHRWLHAPVGNAPASHKLTWKSFGSGHGLPTLCSLHPTAALEQHVSSASCEHRLALPVLDCPFYPLPGSLPVPGHWRGWVDLDLSPDAASASSGGGWNLQSNHHISMTPHHTRPHR